MRQCAHFPVTSFLKPLSCIFSLYSLFFGMGGGRFAFRRRGFKFKFKFKRRAGSCLQFIILGQQNWRPATWVNNLPTVGLQAGSSLGQQN